jgi:hypothetical protein
MMAAAESGVSMGDFRRDPVQMARCFIESVERYELDGIMVDVDTAAGAPLARSPSRGRAGGCRGELLTSLDQVRDLGPSM